MDKILRAIQQLLKASIAAGSSPLEWLKRVYVGDPVQVPLDSQPCLIIKPISSDYSSRGTKYDSKTHTIQIILLYNQRDYYESRRGAAKAVSTAVRSASVVTVTTSTAHGLTVGQDITIEWSNPEWYNGTYKVATVTNSTTFTYSKPVNPGAYVSGASVYGDNIEIVNKVMEAIERTEESNDEMETIQYTICGTIQKNQDLLYNDGVSTYKTASRAKVKNVSYLFSQIRGFPSYEVVTTVEVLAIWDR